RTLGYFSVYAPAAMADDGDDGVAIVSRAPIVATELIELPSFDLHINSKRRVALAATIQQDGRPITVYATHLLVRLTVAERRHQVLPLLEHAKRRTTPVIIAGDFNPNPFTWIAHLIAIPMTAQPVRLEEFVRSEGFDTPVTNSGPTNRYINMKLDAIYT